MKIWLLQSKVTGKYKIKSYGYLSSPTLTALSGGYYATRREAREYKSSQDKPVQFFVEAKRLTLRG